MQEYFVYFKFLQRGRAENPPPRRVRGFVQRFPKKKFDDFMVVNASDKVYDVLAMTNFTEIMTVKKAYRTISVDGCVMLGKGACGTVYKLDDETIIAVETFQNELLETAEKSNVILDF